MPDLREQSHALLAPSLPLLRWLAEAPAWQRVPIRQRALLRWLAACGSLNLALSRSVDRQAATQHDLADPLLVVGVWRSGTTVMHELLTAATGLSTPRNWHCMNAAAFATSPRRTRGATIARPMDGLPIGDESPQEDEFALLTAGVPSAYRAFWQPQRIGELVNTLDPDFWLAHPKWLSEWESFLRAVLRATPGAHEPMILKSPNHSYRLPAIVQRFPRLRAVWMTRPAAQIFQSNRRMWRTMFALYGLAGSSEDSAGLDHFLILAMERAAETLIWSIEHLPPTQFVAVSQEGLRTNGEAITRRVLERLRLTPIADSSALRNAVERLSKGRVETYTATIPSVQAAACARLDEAQDRALRHAGIDACS